MIQGVTVAQLESLAARAPKRADLVPYHGANAAGSAGQHAAAPADVVSRARAYLATIPPAVSGQHGHDRTFYAANRLVRGFDLSTDAAFPLLSEWNTRCEPPWSEHELRRKLDQAAKQSGSRGFLLTATLPRSTAGQSSDSGADGSSGDGSPRQYPSVRFRNFTFDEVQDGDTMKKVKRGRPLPELAEELHRLTYGWPKRIGATLFVLDTHDRPLHLQTTESLFAWIGSTLATSYPSGFDPVEWDARAGPTKSEFRAHLEQTAEQWESIEAHPHEPPIPGAYYCPFPAAGGDGTALREFVQMFAPATPEDEDLIRAYIATLLWGGPAGQRPMWLFTAAEGDRKAGRGIGKSVLASTVAEIVGGALEVKQTDDYEQIKTRLLSPEARQLRVMLLDNLKTLRFTWGDIEGLITSKVISGKELYQGEGRRPNFLSLVVTANAPSLNTDISDRAIIVQLTRPGFDAGWFERMDAFVKEKKWAIIGDAMMLLRDESKPVAEPTRWGPWQREVLARVAPDPEAVQKLINARSGEVNVDAEESAEVRAAVADLIRERLVRLHDLHQIGDQTVADAWEAMLGARTHVDAGAFTNPEHVTILIDAGVLAEKVGPIVERKGSPQVGAAIRALGISGLTSSKRNGRVVWTWTGADSSAFGDAQTCIIVKDALITVKALRDRQDG